MNFEMDEYIQRIRNEDDIFNKATLIHFLTKEKNIKVKIVAEKLELSSSYVCNMVRILKLPELIRDGYYSKLITPTHMFILSRLKTEEDMIAMYEKVLKYDYSSLELERQVRLKLYGVSTQGERMGKELTAKIVNKFQSIDEDVKVIVIQTRIKAKVIIECKGNFKKTTAVLKKLGKSSH